MDTRSKNVQIIWDTLNKAFKFTDCIKYKIGHKTIDLYSLHLQYGVRSQNKFIKINHTKTYFICFLTADEPF